MINLYTYINEANTPTNSFNLVAVGDALCHKNLHDYAQKNGYDNIFTEYKLNKNDLNFYNQESIIGGGEFHGSFFKREQHTVQPHFNSTPDFANVFLRQGFNLVSLANNHTLDMDGDAVRHSIKFWKNKNVISTGQYLNDEERFKERIYTKNGIKFAFFAYTDKINTKYNDPLHPFYRNDFDYDLARKDIESIRDKVDVIIVSIHWGSEHTFTSNQDQRDIAKFFSELGVHIVLGHHSHCVQTTEWIGNTFVAYSLGNFVASQENERISSVIGLQLSINICKTKNGVTITPKGRLLYFHRSPDRDFFKLFYLDNVDKTYLPDRDVLLRQYWDVVNRFNALEKDF